MICCPTTAIILATSSVTCLQAMESRWVEAKPAHLSKDTILFAILCSIGRILSWNNSCPKQADICGSDYPVVEC